MNVLTISTLFPNSQQHRHGVFVENRLQKLKEKYPDVNITVIAPVPYFPFQGERFGVYGKYAQVPVLENRKGINVHHPRYLVIPKIGMNVTPHFLYKSLLKAAKALIASGQTFDMIDAHYFYPDGVAANWLAKELNLPIAITARGNDISLIPDYAKPRKFIKKTLLEADACIGVCQALVDEMKAIQPAQKKYFAFRNGVDLDVFKPISTEIRHKLRTENNVEDKFVAISVGHLIERKGFHLTIDALKSLKEVHLFIAGDGELEKQLKAQVEQNNLQSQVTFLGAVPHQELVNYYGMADCMVLASSREGWANVLLESMACGTPVVATPIWGTPEVVAEKAAGILTKDRSAGSIANAILSLQKNYPQRREVREYAENFSWDDTCDAQYHLFSKLTGRNNG
jgi:glycosyltransferase involved in cell wall biosynthesis